MAVFYFVIAILGVLAGLLIWTQAPTVTQEIVAVLLIGFSVVTLVLSDILNVLQKIKSGQVLAAQREGEQPKKETQTDSASAGQNEQQSYTVAGNYRVARKQDGHFCVVDPAGRIVKGTIDYETEEDARQVIDMIAGR